MFQGIDCINGDIANAIAKRCFTQGVVIETSGANDQVLIVFCPLTISDDNLNKGSDVLVQIMRTVRQALNKWPQRESSFCAEDVNDSKATRPAQGTTNKY